MTTNTTNGRGSALAPTTTTTGAPASAAPEATPATARHPDALDLPGLGTAVTALGAAGVASYVLGVLVLQQQLARAGSLDVATAWQAAFLVPRPTVVLHAARAVGSPTSLVVAGFTLVSALATPVAAWVAHLTAANRPWRAVGFRGALLTLYLGAIFLVAQVLPYPHGVPLWAAVAAGLGAGYGGSLIARGLGEGGAFSRRALWGLLVLYLSSLLVAYFTFAAQRPLLAPATATYPGGRVQHGLYLAHADGYWWLVVPPSAGRRGAVVPIRDGSAVAVVGR